VNVLNKVNLKSLLEQKGTSPSFETDELSVHSNRMFVGNLQTELKTKNH